MKEETARREMLVEQKQRELRLRVEEREGRINTGNEAVMKLEKLRRCNIFCRGQILTNLTPEKERKSSEYRF